MLDRRLLGNGIIILSDATRDDEINFPPEGEIGQIVPEISSVGKVHVLQCHPVSLILQLPDGVSEEHQDLLCRWIDDYVSHAQTHRQAA